jgi:hypothetical protein
LCTQNSVQEIAMSNLKSPLQEEELAHSAETTAASTAVNTSTKAELLNRAKAAVEAGDQSMHEAAEALAVAQELHSASQAEMARAIGKSEAYVCRLLQWRRTGYEAESPFGPTTKTARLKHAKDRATSGASKPRKPRKPKATVAADDSTGAAGDTGAETSTAACSATTCDDAKALAEFKVAVEHWLSRMSYEAKCEAVGYVLKKSGVRVS